MKSFNLVLVVTLLVGSYLNAQSDLRAGINAGFPVGENGDFSSFVANIDLEYDFEVSEQVNAGLSSGVTVFLGTEEFSDFKYIPIAASIDFSFSETFSADGDIGYAASLESNINTDFLYRILLRYQASPTIDIQGRFTSLSGDPGTLSHASFGVGFRF